jgi:hypothetical protein
VSMAEIVVVLFTVRFLEARSTSFRRLLVDMCLLAVFVVSLWCSSRSPRLCGLSVIGAWPSSAWVVSVQIAREGCKPGFFAVYGGSGDDRRLLALQG